MITAGVAVGLLLAAVSSYVFLWGARKVGEEDESLMPLYIFGAGLIYAHALIASFILPAVILGVLK